MPSDTQPNQFSDHPDYASFELPEDTPKDEWAWQHRRAYIYRQLIDRGHHQLLNKTDLATEFGVTRKTIYDDLDKIAEYIDQEMATNHRSETVAVFQKAVKELLDEGEYAQAAKVQSQFSQWLAGQGEIDTEPQTVRVEHSVDDEQLDFLNEVF